MSSLVFRSYVLRFFVFLAFQQDALHHPQEGWEDRGRRWSGQVSAQAHSEVNQQGCQVRHFRCSSARFRAASPHLRGSSRYCRVSSCFEDGLFQVHQEEEPLALPTRAQWCGCLQFRELGDPSSNLDPQGWLIFWRSFVCFY